MATKFNKTSTNFWLDVFLLCNFLCLCWISVVLRYAFPAAPTTDGWTLWGWDYLFWSDVQFATLCLMAAAILLHVMLHWPWICGVISNWRKKQKGLANTGQSDTGTRTIWGVALLIVLVNLLGVGIAAAVLSIQGPTY